MSNKFDNFGGIVPAGFKWSNLLKLSVLLNQPFKNVSEIEKFLCGITTPSLNNDQINLCEKDLSETDLYNAMKNMQNNKSPGNDGLTKEFYEGFWDEIKELLIASATEAKQVN